MRFRDHISVKTSSTYLHSETLSEWVSDDERPILLLDDIGPTELWSFLDNKWTLNNVIYFIVVCRYASAVPKVPTQTYQI